MSARHEPNESGGPGPSLLPRIVATGLFTGYSPIAPGTAGSLLAVVIYLIPGFEDPIVLAFAILFAFFAGQLTASHMERFLGKDPGVVVIDEVVGMWITLLFLPKSIVLIALAFLAFRFHDIVKIAPARQIERVPSGWGCMLDDVFAGIYANATMWVILLVFPSLK